MKLKSILALLCAVSLVTCTSCGDEPDSETSRLSMPDLTDVDIDKAEDEYDYIKITDGDESDSETSRLFMPDLTGVDIDKAESEYDFIEITEQDTDYSNEYDEGVIIDQSVEPGKKIKKGERVEVTVSMGKKADLFTMPNLVGMDYNEAKSKYGNNFKIDLESSEYNEADENTIIEQSIPADTPFNKGDILKVKISKGMATVEVPNLADMNKDIAQEQLRMRELKAEFKNSTDTKIQKNHVIKTEPEAGTQVSKGATVIVYVSMGVDAGQVSVDKYVGLKAEDADAAAKYDGLTVKLEYKHSYEEEGTVVEQSIAKGEKVKNGTEIILYISTGVSTESEIPFCINFPANANGKFAVAFIIIDEDGKTRTISTTTIPVPETSSWEQNIKGSGENVLVTVILTNMETNTKAEIGRYNFNFDTGVVIPQSEDVNSAFEQVGGVTESN